jgi:hypothetical protein
MTTAMHHADAPRPPTPFSLARTALAAALAVGLGGCAAWVDIKPSELPKLNRVGLVPASELPPEHRGKAMEWVAHVEGRDGGPVVIGGQPSVRITSPAGWSVYEYPVVSTIEGETLTISGRNRTGDVFRLTDVRLVEVLDTVKSADRRDGALATIPFIVLVGGVGAFSYALLNSGK